MLTERKAKRLHLGICSERNHSFVNQYDSCHSRISMMHTKITLSTSNRVSLDTYNGVDGYLLLENDAFVDTFRGIKIRWILRTCNSDGNTRGVSSQVQYYDLVFPKKARDLVMESYLPFVSLEAESSPFFGFL
ncbi:hypothetical protein CARUB_v10027360mg [Capsella rubella]|uniref:Uncharacterized protein n=1 Tax=Capsella rubella TaxID=81985 RepID=R0GJY8_9BRAS|nr:hypothetical protein CARUB_v10027360mg [Capsella rubella]